MIDAMGEQSNELVMYNSCISLIWRIVLFSIDLILLNIIRMQPAGYRVNHQQS